MFWLLIKRKIQKKQDCLGDSLPNPTQAVESENSSSIFKQSTDSLNVLVCLPATGTHKGKLSVTDKYNLNRK